MVRGMPELEEDLEDDDNETTLAPGDILEQGWNQRGGTSALRRNAEVWKFALKSAFRVLKPRSMRKKGASDAEIEKAQTDAAEFIRDGLLTLGPTFVKLGQVRCR
jgi:predicted unusual protein kinase regulating ubiquinone biosynthesis (AarF/ABC1/UbiB family)